jgi:hypothetical protein
MEIEFVFWVKKSGPFSVTENGPKAKKAYPKTSLVK